MSQRLLKRLETMPVIGYDGHWELRQQDLDSRVWTSTFRGQRLRLRRDQRVNNEWVVSCYMIDDEWIPASRVFDR